MYFSFDSIIFYLIKKRLKKFKTPSFLRSGPEKDLMEKLAVRFDFVKRLALTNIWLFSPLIEMYVFFRFVATTSRCEVIWNLKFNRLFSKLPSLNALQRTTTAITIFSGGFKDNVLPTYSEFVVNHRIHSLQRSEKKKNLPT